MNRPNTSSSTNESKENDAVELASPGEDRCLAFAPSAMRTTFSTASSTLVWHGSSIAILAKADALLRQEFTIKDPEKDFRKWRRLGARPYCFAVANAADGASSAMSMCCCLRCLLDGDWDNAPTDPNGNQVQMNASTVTAISSSPSSPALRRRRLVVDYLCTLPEFQGRGYASHLLHLALQVASSHGANCYVVAHEDASVYWMEKGFVLVQEAAGYEGPLHRRLNQFDDSFLLQLPSNQVEDPASLETTTPGNNCTSDSDSSSDSSSSSSSSSSGSDSASLGEDDDEKKNLQKAIMDSLNMKK